MDGLYSMHLQVEPAGQLTNLSGTIAPYGFYLITEASGANGAEVPTADASGAILMAAGAGKVKLLNNANDDCRSRILLVLVQQLLL